MTEPFLFSFGIELTKAEKYNMKVAIFLLCLMPLVFCEKRFLLDDILDSAEIKNLVSSVVEKFGSDATEQDCEKECLILFTNDILDLGCDFACKGIQNLIKIIPHNQPATAATR
ncbi:uncharacterized protein LOC124280165 [Haliotis rubra]|uniref:uncharacterized protein LOC124280165 n=1 Tax=Haliotis rubra TaxID=36100 RepID=UPI001EE53A9E|nr:uncharacterized protein LOC124280165 [Haliotis rubra]